MTNPTNPQEGPPKPESVDQVLAGMRRDLGLSDDPESKQDVDARLAKMRMDLFGSADAGSGPPAPLPPLAGSASQGFQFTPPETAILPGGVTLRKMRENADRRSEEKRMSSLRNEALRETGPFAGMSATERNWEIAKQEWKDQSLVAGAVTGESSYPLDGPAERDTQPIPAPQFGESPAAQPRSLGVNWNTSEAVDERNREAQASAEKRRDVRQFGSLEAEAGFPAFLAKTAGGLAGLLTDVAAVPGGGAAANIAKVAGQAAIVPEAKYQAGTSEKPEGTMLSRGLHGAAAMTLGMVGGKAVGGLLEKKFVSQALGARVGKNVAKQTAVGAGFGVPAAVETGDLRHIPANAISFGATGLHGVPRARSAVDPFFAEMARGNQAGWLMPGLGNPARMSASERAFQPPPSDMLAKAGIVRVAVPSKGVLYVNANHPMFAGKDIRQAVDKYVADGRFSEILGYSEGAADRDAATHTVTARDAEGREILSVDTSTPVNEASRMKQVEGVESVGERPRSIETNQAIEGERIVGEIEARPEPPVAEPIAEPVVAEPITQPVRRAMTKAQEAGLRYLNTKQGKRPTPSTLKALEKRGFIEWTDLGWKPTEQAPAGEIAGAPGRFGEARRPRGVKPTPPRDLPRGRSVDKIKEQVGGKTKDLRPDYVMSPDEFAKKEYPAQTGKPFETVKKGIGEVARDVLAGRGANLTKHLGHKFSILQGVSQLRKRLSRTGRGGTLASGQGSKPSGAGVGDFRFTSETTRGKGRGDVPTQMHEAGHFLQLRLFGAQRDEAGRRTVLPESQALFGKHRETLKSLDYARAKDGSPKDGGRDYEGFAEFAKSYLMYPKEVTRDFPELTKDFAEAVLQHDATAPRNERIGEVIEGIQRDHQIWLRSDRAAGLIYRPGQARSMDGFGSDMENRVLRWRSNVLNEQEPFETIESLISEQRLEAGNPKLEADETPSLLATAVRGGPEVIAARFIDKRPVNARTLGDVPGSKSLTEIFEPLDPADEPFFSAYAVEATAKYRLEYLGEMEEVARSIADEIADTSIKRSKTEGKDLRDRKKAVDRELQEAKRLWGAAQLYLKSIQVNEKQLDDSVAKREAGNPEFAEILADLQDYFGHVTQFEADSGLYDQAYRDRLRSRHKVRVPWMREHVESPSLPTGAGGKVMDVGKSPSQKALFGSESPIHEIVPAIILQTQMGTRLAQSAEVGQKLGRLLDELEGSDAFARDVEKPVKLTSGTFRELMDQMKAEGMSTKDLDPDASFQMYRPDDMFGLFNDNIVKYRDADGKTRYKEITDPLLLRAVTGLGKQFQMKWAAPLFAGKQFVRTAVVIGSGFAAANRVRDVASGKLYTGRFNPSGYVKSIGSIIAGNVFQNSDAPWAVRARKRYEEAEKHGVFNSTLVRAAFGKEWMTGKRVVEGTVGRKLRGTLDPKQLHMNYRLFVDAVRINGETSEYAVRMAEHDRILKDVRAGESAKSRILRAIKGAKEAGVDFSKHGGSEWAKGWASFTAFLNPHLQGVDKSYQTIKNRPADAAIYFASLAAGSSALFMLNNQGEHKRRLYGRLTENDKTAYWTAFAFTESSYAKQFRPLYKAAYDSMGSLDEADRKRKATAEADRQMLEYVRKNTFKMPVPHELALPGTILDKVVWGPLMRDDKAIGDGLSSSVIHSISSLMPPLMPNTFDMASKLSGNYWPSLGRFRQSKISSFKREGLRKVAQFADTTPEVFKWIANMQASVPFLQDAIWSPADMEAAFNVGLVRDLNDVGDLMFARERIGRGGGHDIPFVRGTLRRFTVNFSGRGGEGVGEIYDRISEARKIHNEATAAYKRRDIEGFIGAIKDNPREHTQYALLQKFSGKLSQMTAAIRIYKTDSGKLPDENGKEIVMGKAKRRDMVDRISMQMISEIEAVLSSLRSLPTVGDEEYKKMLDGYRKQAAEEWGSK